MPANPTASINRNDAVNDMVLPNTGMSRILTLYSNKAILRWKHREHGPAGTPTRVGVNRFAAQFCSGSLPERVAAMVSANNLPAELIEIELTKTNVVNAPFLPHFVLVHLSSRRRALGIA